MFGHPTPVAPPPSRPTFPWFLVLCLVGLDYFSSLAYLPSLALLQSEALAPFVAVGVVVLTLGAALPIYFYVVGRSPHGHGATGLLEANTHGWRGKLLVLFMLGFVGTDFVITRTLSTSDAATHLLANPNWRDQVEKVSANKESIRAWLPSYLQGAFFDFWNEQLILTLLLVIAGFALYFFLVRGMSRGFLRLAVGVVLLYLFLTGVIITSGVVYLNDHPELITSWQQRLREQWEVGDPTSTRAIWWVLILAAVSFPPMALGLSGFELSSAAAPLVRGSPQDDPLVPRGRIFNTRLLLLSAALVMSLFVLGSVTITTLLVPEGGLKRFHPDLGTQTLEHRALAYLAHGGEMVNQRYASEELNPLFGTYFGTLYDLSTVLILCLAGASAAIGLKDLVPEYLTRFGMQPVWAHKTGVILHLFNTVILVVTVAFQASVEAQMGAYATSVLALLVGAALAGFLDVRARWAHTGARFALMVPFVVLALLFGFMGLLTVVQNFTGVLIALLFVAVVFIMAIVSRWRRSTELRFEGFELTDDYSRQRWEEVCKLEFQVLVPHQPGHLSLEEKERKIREDHRLAANVPLIFVEVYLGDPSDFIQKPLMKIESREGREVVQVSRCTSVAHVIAAVGLAFREVGRPPQIHFDWSDESPHAANLHFLLLGQGNVPWMVRELLRKAERDPLRQPRVVVG